MHTPNPNRLSRSESIRLWHRVNLGSVIADAPDLTTRQMAILTTVYLESAPHTVRSLAARLRVTKAVVTRGLNTLGDYGFVTRGPDSRDKRSVVVLRTSTGSRYLSDFAERTCFEARTLSQSSSHKAGAGKLTASKIAASRSGASPASPRQPSRHQSSACKSRARQPNVA